MQKWAKQTGFTIVELLIVIVVIAILAAITIVAYNGMQVRAKTSASHSTANSVYKKAKLYYASNGRYPIDVTELTNANTASSYYVTGVDFYATLADSYPTNSLIFRVCGTTDPVTASTVTGIAVRYRNYVESRGVSMSMGEVQNGGITCQASTP